MSSQDLSPSLTHKIKENWPYKIMLAIIAFVAFWIRILPKGGVFLSNDFVRFGGNDPWYHMRVVDTIVHNYPHRIFYNPMTQYPFGSNIHFGPLFDQAIAFIAMIFGLGDPSPELVNTIGAYFPAVLGALTIIPVYFIGKYLGGTKTGILAAILIAFAPGQFLSRSIIGFTDHHVAETLFSTLFMMFFILALISGRKKNLRIEQVLNREFNVIKEPLVYAFLAGIMYAAYQLSWPGAPLFGFIVVIFAFFQFILNHIKGQTNDYLGITGVVAFFVELLLILPFIHPEMGFAIYYYSWLHVLTSLGAIAAFAFMAILDREFRRRKVKAYYYPAVLIGAGILGLLLLYVGAPSFYSLIMDVPGTIFGIKTGGASTIAEASSIFYYGGVFTFSRAFDNFTATGFLASILGIFVLGIKVSRKPKPEEVMVLVWSIFMLLAIYGQNRFAYYYSVNVAVLSAYVGGLLLDKVKWKELDEKFRVNVKSPADIPNFFKFVKIEQVVAVLAIVIVLIVPVYGSAMEYTKGTGGPNGPWIESTLWLRSNTPDPGMDYYGIYEAPENGELFEYPDSAYGVMSWWDYGHWIETVGHRMPNANPFQAGIGGRRNSLEEDNKPGSSTFFTAQSEEEATAVLEAIHPDPDKAAARYVVSDVEMATGKFYAMTAWTLDTEGYYESTFTGNGYQTLPAMRYYNSMEARLHLFDGTGLEQYRLVHETWAGQTVEVGYKQVFNYLYLNKLDANDPRGKLAEEDTGYVKIFEYVEGAKISGTASPNEKITINTTIMTGQGRDFEYSQSTTANGEGRYEFTVPYSTEGPIAGETQFDTAPVRPYLVSYGSTTKEVRVSEEAVLNGEEIEV